MNTNSLATIEPLISSNAMAVFRKSWQTSEELLTKTHPIVEESLSDAALDTNEICIAVVGSTARREAMNASDIDLLPIWCGNPNEFPHFQDLTGKVREDLRQKTGLEVSTSRNLMKATQLNNLCRPDGIGGDDDKRRTLTQRMLVLTESEQLGGNKPIDLVRRKILEAYVGERNNERTVSKHPMTVCNDIARYYRTLCVDYKSRAETKPESWAERHAKLRNPRKIWYFSTLMAISTRIAALGDSTSKNIFDCLALTFSEPPILRLASATDANTAKYTASILEAFSTYLSEMGDPEYRARLASVEFEDRNNPSLQCGNKNPYYSLHLRSRDLSKQMLSMLQQSPKEVQDKVFQWFFL